MSMSLFRRQIAGRNHCVKVVNTSFGKVEKFKYLEKTLMNYNWIYEEIKSKINSRNACYHIRVYHNFCLVSAT
jgi:hypothetical protein